MVSSDSYLKTLKGVQGLLTRKHGVQPDGRFLFAEISLLALAGTMCLLFFRSLNKRNANKLIHSFGVRFKKVARATKEIERKTFHMLGLLVPLSYYLATKQLEYSEEEFAFFCWVSTLFIWIGDGYRVLNPKALDYPPYSVLKTIIREKEKTALSGTCYFSLGCTLAIALYPPSVAMTAICWLVLGDLMAALFGVSFGGEVSSVKLGREGKKSLEGSAAMFVTCAVVGLVFFAGVRLSDYAIIIGSLAATTVELYEPFGLNDNITIPILSGAALQWALARVERC